MKKILLIVFCALFSLISFCDERKYVNSFHDFYVHTVAHIERTKALGLELFDKFPAEFRGIDRDLLEQFLSLHDQGKINTKKNFLEHFGKLDSNKRIIAELYENYGRPTSSLTAREIQIRNKIINKLNELDKAVGREFFANHGLLNKDGSLSRIAKKMLKIEEISDHVDRGMNEVSPEEFSRPMVKESQILSKQREKKMAKYLENNYENLTARSKFSKVMAQPNKCLAQALSQLLL